MLAESIIKKRNYCPSSGDNMDYKKFIILGGPRTGSSYLSSLLRSHSQMVSYHELFHDSDVITGYRKYDQSKNLNLKKTRNNDPKSFLDQFVFKGYSDQIKMVGFKILHSQAKDNLKLVWDYLKQCPDLKIIFIWRKNILKSLVSLKISYLTDKWIITDPSQSTDNLWVRLNYKSCRMYFQMIDSAVAEYTKLFNKNKKLTVHYEDLVDNLDSELIKIQKFLDVKPETLGSRLKKQNNRKLSEVLLNYSELKRDFTGTRWESFFEE